MVDTMAARKKFTKFIS